MKVFLDRNLCERWQAGCDSCFGNRILENRFDLEGCIVEVVRNDDPEIVFYIKDRDGEDKVLTVTQENWPEAYDSWGDLLEKQREASH